MKIIKDEIKEDNSIHLNGYLITSLFGKRSIMYSGHHKGIDIAAPRGTRILATADGIVKQISYSPNYGNYIIIKHNDEYETLYAHLDKINVKEGDNVLKDGEKRKYNIAQNKSSRSFLKSIIDFTCFF